MESRIDFWLFSKAAERSSVKTSRGLVFWADFLLINLECSSSKIPSFSLESRFWRSTPDFGDFAEIGIRFWRSIPDSPKSGSRFWRSTPDFGDRDRPRPPSWSSREKTTCVWNRDSYEYLHRIFLFPLTKARGGSKQSAGTRRRRGTVFFQE